MIKEDFNSKKNTLHLQAKIPTTNYTNKKSQIFHLSINQKKKIIIDIYN